MQMLNDDTCSYIQPTRIQPILHLNRMARLQILNAFTPAVLGEFNDIDSRYDELSNVQYWYNMSHESNEFHFAMVELQHYNNTRQMLALPARDPHVPISYDEAMLLPLWAKAISTELEKFRAHNCLLLAHFTGQHLVPMLWNFSIKTNGTYKARLVGQGDLMIPWIDFNPKEVYCDNISACGLKLVLTSC